MHNFDLIDYQEQVRNTSAPKKLYEIWDELCKKFEKRLISEYDLAEMKDLIFPALVHLHRLKELIDTKENAPLDLDAYRQSRKQKTEAS